MAMRELRIVGAYDDVLDTELGDVLGRDLTGSTVRCILWPEGDTYPAADDAGWKTPTADLGEGGGPIAWAIGAGQAAGHFHWWLKLTVAGVARPVLLLVRDPDNPELPWHIWVH